MRCVRQPTPPPPQPVQSYKFYKFGLANGTLEKPLGVSFNNCNGGRHYYINPKIEVVNDPSQNFQDLDSVKEGTYYDNRSGGHWLRYFCYKIKKVDLETLPNGFYLQADRYDENNGNFPFHYSLSINQEMILPISDPQLNITTSVRGIKGTVNFTALSTILADDKWTRCGIVLVWESLAGGGVKEADVFFDDESSV